MQLHGELFLAEDRNKGSEGFSNKMQYESDHERVIQMN
jgi:hypothetical protein